MPFNSDYCVTLSTRKEAAQKAAERKVEVGEYATMDDIVVVPLYRHPRVAENATTRLTDAEREAVEDCWEWAMTADHRSLAATLRGLLERLGGGE